MLVVFFLNGEFCTTIKNLNYCIYKGFITPKKNAQWEPNGFYNLIYIFKKLRGKMFKFMANFIKIKIF